MDFKEKPIQFLDGKNLLAFVDPSCQFKDQVEEGKFVSDIIHWWRHLRHKMDVMVCRHLLSCQTKVALYKENILFFFWVIHICPPNFEVEWKIKSFSHLGALSLLFKYQQCQGYFSQNVIFTLIWIGGTAKSFHGKCRSNIFINLIDMIKSICHPSVWVRCFGFANSI